jgi:hypothetical protein
VRTKGTRTTMTSQTWSLARTSRTRSSRAFCLNKWLEWRNGVRYRIIGRLHARACGGWQLGKIPGKLGYFLHGHGWRCCRYGESSGCSKIARLYKINSAPYLSPHPTTLALLLHAQRDEWNYCLADAIRDTQVRQIPSDDDCTRDILPPSEVTGE